MFSAIGRLLRVIWYTITFQFNKVENAWSTNAAVVNVTYDKIAQQQNNRIQLTQKAVAGQVKLKLRQENRLKELANEIAEKEEGMQGAFLAAQDRINKLKSEGKTPEQIQQDAEYLSCYKAYEDLGSTLQAKKDEASRIEADLQAIETEIGEISAGLESDLRELDTIEKERHSTIADMETAKQRKELGDLKAGLTTTGTTEERRRMQDLRQQLKAEAVVAEKLGGIDKNKATKKYQEYARQSQRKSEFDRLLGLSVAEAAPAVPVAPVQEKLPEA